MLIRNLLKFQENELILSELLGKSREYLILHDDIKLNKKQLTQFKKSKSLLKKGWPLAYVLGYRWFYNNKFIVTKNVLIPRPETEQLVELALKTIEKKKPKTIIDIGTGSGAIIVTIAKNLKSQKRPALIASDISNEALSVAKNNARKITPGAKITFLKGDLSAAFKKQHDLITNTLLLANLPYLEKKELSDPSIKYEPALALYGGEKGFALIQKLLQQISSSQIAGTYSDTYIKTHTKNAEPLREFPPKLTILLEAHYNHGPALTKLIHSLWPKATIKTHKDLNNLPRVFEISGN